MRKRLAAVLLLTSALLPVGIAGQTAQPRHLELSFDDHGRVTLAAQGVTIREILAEWARQGGSRFVDAERLTGAVLSMPIRFDNQPELEVLQSLLASAAGVIVGPKLLDAPGRSRLGTVVILASSSPTASNSFSTSQAPRGVAPPPVTPGSPDDELPPVRPPAAGETPAETTGPTAPANRPGVFQPVQIVPITPAGTGRGGGGGAPPTTGRGGGGGGGGFLP